MKYTNKYNLPLSIVEAIINDDYDLDVTDKTKISVTALASPPKIRQLTNRHWDEIEEDVSDCIWKLLGQSVHAILARIDDKDRFVEERIEVFHNGLTISGKPDIYESKIKRIQDYKVTSVWVFKYDKSDWISQLNCYAWLIRKFGFPVESIRINAILRDWSRMGLKNDPTYPEIPFKEVEIPLWSFEEQTKYIEERIELHKKAALEPNEDDIEECLERERWSKPDSWAVMKNDNIKASKVLGSENEAKIYIEGCQTTDKKKNKYFIQHRIGGDTRCENFCKVNKYCSYYKKVYIGG